MVTSRIKHTRGGQAAATIESMGLGQDSVDQVAFPVDSHLLRSQDGHAILVMGACETGR